MVIPINTSFQDNVTARRSRTLGLRAVTAIVIGSMIGSGVFSLPQNMAAHAGPLAIIIGWGITGMGILALALVYRNLSMRLSTLNAGPYAYAKAGFGPFIGFNSAWGYWISAWVGNVSYAVVMFSALSYFVPSFGDGNSWQAIVGASIVLWLIHALTLMGVRHAAFVNLVTTIAKIAPIVLFIGVITLVFKIDVFSLNWTAAGDVKLGPILAQVKSTMLVTLWVFIGIEGASVVSANAKRRKDIGTATILGFLICLAMYALVSLLSLGILSRPELAALKNPSMAGVLEHVVGRWGAVVINSVLVVSVAGAFLSWTILAAEVPHIAARDGTMPRFLGRENVNGAPSVSLWMTNGLVQLFLLLTYFASSTYQALFSIASVAILLPYVFSGTYALKLALTGETYAKGDNRAGDCITGAIATLYGIWLIYAAGTTYLLMAALLYTPGIVIYVVARREAGQRIFTFLEALIALGLVAAGILAANLMWNGTISPF